MSIKVLFKIMFYVIFYFHITGQLHPEFGILNIPASYLYLLTLLFLK